MGRRKNKLSRFVPLLWEIIDSKAWQDLTNAARVALVHLKRKVTSPNPGEISLSYREMEKIMHRHTFAEAIRQLEKIGFITREQRGGLYRRRNFFRLSDEWRRYANLQVLKLAPSTELKLAPSGIKRKFDGAKNSTC